MARRGVHHATLGTTPQVRLISIKARPMRAALTPLTEGLTLYFLCGPDSQKVANLGRDDGVSLTVDHHTPQVMEIAGLSMDAHAVVDPAEAEKALRLS